MMSSGVYSVFLANTAKIKMTSVSMRYKVSRGAISTAGVIAHLRYIDRNGRLEIETDEGDHLKGKGIEKDLTDDWDLDSANAQCRGPYRGKAGRKPARLVHNVILSMPKGTPPEKLSMPQSRPMPSIASGCHELRINDQGLTWRLMYRIDADVILILAVFAKKTEKTPDDIIRTCRNRLRDYEDASRKEKAPGSKRLEDRKR